jgi:acetyl esterase/lipase
MPSSTAFKMPFMWWISLLLVVLSACAPINQTKSEAGNWLSILSSAIDLKNVTKLEDFHYGSFSRQTLDVYVPKTSARGILVFGYGGGFKDGNKDEYGFAGEAFASLGFVTIVYDYRLNPVVTFPTYLEDAALVVRWTVDHAKRFGVNPKNLVVAGHSAGAYLTAMLATDKRYLERVGLKPTDIKLALCLSGGYDFYDSSRVEHNGFLSDDLRDVFGNPSTYLETQPINFVNGDEPAFLIVHGAQDQILPVVQARNFVQKLQEAHETVKYLEYPNLDHAQTITTMAQPLRFLSSVYADLKTELEKQF